MTDILTLNQINLALQIVVLLIFLTGITFKIRGRTLRHGIIMALAYSLNVVSLAFFMLPLLLSALPIVTAFFDTYAAILILHHSLGVVAFILSTFLVGRFAYARFTARLCKGKWLMIATATVWGISLVLGIYLYLSGYFPG
jgi:uncharacterized membrane protein YozB (DUF420 family)